MNDSLEEKYNELLAQYDNVMKLLFMLLQTLGGRYEINIWDWTDKDVNRAASIVSWIDYSKGNFVLEYREPDGTNTDQHNSTS